MQLLTLGQTRTQETRDLLDQSLRSDESIVFASQLLDELLVLVQLLQVVSRHGIDTTVLGTIDIVLVTENAMSQLLVIGLPRIVSAQPGEPYQMLMLGRGTEGSLMVPLKRLSRSVIMLGRPLDFSDRRRLDQRTRVIVLEADLKLDGLEEVTFFLVEGVFEEILDLGTHSGCSRVSIALRRVRRSLRRMTNRL